MAQLNIILPVFNEEDRLERGVVDTIAFLEKSGMDDYVLTIIDNASTDATEAIATRLASERDHVRYHRIEEKGVGAAFRYGVSVNESPIVGYMDVDLSTDLTHLLEMMDAFEEDPSIGMVNASRWADAADTSGRKWYRNLTSTGLTWLLKNALGMQATDAICGFKFFRKDLAERLIEESGDDENGWFYIIELLLRAERSSSQVRELPVHWEDDSAHSKVDVIPLVKNYMQQIMRLRRLFKSERSSGYVRIDPPQEEQ